MSDSKLKTNAELLLEFSNSMSEELSGIDSIEGFSIDDLTLKEADKTPPKEKIANTLPIIGKEKTVNNIVTSQSIEIVECDENINYLSDKWKETPCGIIECQVPHIGATYLEMHSNRDSIIVFPDEKEAYRCSKEYPNILYISDNIIEKGISGYMQELQRHKFIVSPKNIDKLQFLFHKNSQEDALKECFFMVKNMEQLQAESSYKADNDKVLDFYLKFPKDKRCIYTTDYRAFTHPVLKNEEVHIIKWKNLPKRNIQVISCSNIIGVLKDSIEKLPTNDKVLIVYTTIQQAKLSILNLEKEIQKECCILGNSYNKEEADDFYIQITSKYDTLPKRITFLGIRQLDIEVNEKCHLITVSDTSRGSSLLSLKDIINTSNLCKSDILSDTVIHDTAKCYSQWSDEIDTLVKRAEKIVRLQNTADELSKGDNSLKRLFSIVSTTLKDKATGRIRGRLPNVRLVRKNVWENWAVAYMNMDSLVLRTNLYQMYYKNDFALRKVLNELYSTSFCLPNGQEASQEQQDIEKEEKDKQNRKKEEKRIAILDEILKLHLDGKLKLEHLVNKSKRGNSLSRKVYQEVAKLYPYIDTEELITEMKGIKHGNKIGFKTLNNKIIYWALDDEHPLKLSMNKAFKVGGKYTNAEIREKMNSIIQYHLHKDWSENERKAVALFKCFFNTKRPKKEYIIQSDEYFQGHKERIDKGEDNLLKLFIITDSQVSSTSKRKSKNKSEGEEESVASL